MATDLTDGYGCTSRARALRAVRSACPQLLGVLVTQWQPEVTTAWLQLVDGWTHWCVDRGMWQGSPAANPVFCIALQEALCGSQDCANNDCQGDDELREMLCGVRRLAYADDAFFLGKPRALRTFLLCLGVVLGDYGWTLVWGKSKAWIPATDGMEQLDADAAALFALVPRSRGGLPLLGSAADGAFACTVGTCKRRSR